MANPPTLRREHPEPTRATVKELDANAYRCGFPKCPRPLYKVDPETGTRTLNSRIAHICARREGGPRWDPAQTAEENRGVNNLLLLCIEHADEIDLESRIAAYPINMLNQWKRTQLADFDQLRQG